MKKGRIIFIFSLLLVGCIISLCLGICFGSVSILPSHVFQILLGRETSIDATILLQLRMPHVLCAFLVGGLLAQAGALMQTLLRNPLADPYILGVSGGAALGVLFAILAGLSGALLFGFSFLGSLIAMFLVMLLARMHGGFSSIRLLLTGVMVAMGEMALISFILAIGPQAKLRSMLFWLMGDLQYAHFSLWILFVLLLGALMSFLMANALNLLVRGELFAKSLGLNTKHLYWMVYLLASLLTACAVSLAGCIGFIGLVTPHILRLIGGSDHRFVFPASVLLGGSLLVLADTLSRTLLAPVQIPVGVLTALIGVPAFLVLLQRGYKF